MRAAVGCPPRPRCIDGSRVPGVQYEVQPARASPTRWSSTCSVTRMRAASSPGPGVAASSPNGASPSSWPSAAPPSTAKAGTCSGLHFQAAPHAEVELVRCTRGAIHDVIIDLRPDSPAYRRWFAVELTAANLRLHPPGVRPRLPDAGRRHSRALLRSRIPTCRRRRAGVRHDDPGLRHRLAAADRRRLGEGRALAAGRSRRGHPHLSPPELPRGGSRGYGGGIYHDGTWPHRSCREGLPGAGRFPAPKRLYCPPGGRGPQPDSCVL